MLLPCYIKQFEVTEKSILSYSRGEGVDFSISWDIKTHPSHPMRASSATEISHISTFTHHYYQRRIYVEMKRLQTPPPSPPPRNKTLNICI